jgi:hypothetical protein
VQEVLERQGVSILVSAIGAREAEELVASRLSALGVEPNSVASTAFPEETVILVKVDPDDFDVAVEGARRIDDELQAAGFDGFITVRRSEALGAATAKPVKSGVRDPRVEKLLTLFSTRSRTSETQPSLSYVPDIGANVGLITAARHHLVFGRRGAGKTALLLEGKRLIEASGGVTVWLNMHTFRSEDWQTTFLWIANEVLSRLEGFVRGEPKLTHLATRIIETKDRIISVVNSNQKTTRGLVPAIHDAVSRFSESTGARLFVFLDDFHYLNREGQPDLLDQLHASLRDCDAWLKVAAIRHLSRWFDPATGKGLETGHDADHIELDLSLQDPTRAKSFLEEVARRYALRVSIPSLSGVLSRGALDRLVLASGAVPRDYLTLCARSIQGCRARRNSRLVGVQDVNAAAGNAAKTKISELEDDMASSDRSQFDARGPKRGL